MKRKKRGALRGKYLSKKTGQWESYDSGYELQRFRALDASDLVESWTKAHNIKIVYAEGHKKRRYNPDILVKYCDGRQFLEEIKGKIWNRLNFARKNLAALIWSHHTGIVFRTVFFDDLDRVA